MKNIGKNNLLRVLAATAAIAAVSGFVYGASLKLGTHVGQSVIERAVQCTNCGDLLPFPGYWRQPSVR